MRVEHRGPQAARPDSGTPRTEVDKPKGARHVIDLSRKGETAPPLQKLVDTVLGEAIQREASDVHVEPFDDRGRIRFRVDGTLSTAMVLPADLRERLTSRIRGMAELDLRQKGLPQEGRFRVELRLDGGAREVEFHASVLPTLCGEKVVLRLLERSQLPLGLTRLGIDRDSLARLKEALAVPRGLVLVAGPRRSGKTNTICAALASLDLEALDVVSASDRAELQLPGTVSLASFEDTASALKTDLARTADVLVSGELGDAEAARLALTLAAQGRLVFSIAYASDAAMALLRLRHLAVDPYPMAAALGLVVAQRLVRRICPHCRYDATGTVPAQALRDLGLRTEELPSFQAMAGRGCEACDGTGYRGRVGLFEVMEVSDRVKELILAGARPQEIQARAIAEGMVTLRAAGLEKVRSGETTVEEVLRHTPPPLSPGIPSGVPQAPPRTVTPAQSALPVAPAKPAAPVVTMRPPDVPLQSTDRPETWRRLTFLEAQLTRTETSNRALRLQLESVNPRYLDAQLADARREIEDLRRCLFELNAYRIACELTRSSGTRPTWSVAGETVATVQQLLSRGTC